MSIYFQWNNQTEKDGVCLHTITHMEDSQSILLLSQPPNHTQHAWLFEFIIDEQYDELNRWTWNCWWLN